MCESYVQECSKPCSSAFFVRSTSRVYGGSGRTVTPKVRRAMGLRAYAVVPVPDNGLGSAGTVPCGVSPSVPSEAGLSPKGDCPINRFLGQTPAGSVPATLRHVITHFLAFLGV